MVAIIRECMIRASVDVRARPRASPYALTSSTSGPLTVRALPTCADANSSSNRPSLCHDLDLPIVGHRRQSVTLSVGREGRDGRRFAVRGALLSITGHWRLEPCAAGVLAHLTLDYDVCAALKEQAVNELRSRSPLPIRTDADAILGRAVDDFFERRFAEDAATYCDRLRARLEGPAS